MCYNLIWEGDRIIQEKIFNQWLGVHSLMGKRNYVEIVMNTIEIEHGNIAFSELEEIRLNSYVRCNSGNDRDRRRHKKIVLDECQEINNWLTTNLPLSTDQD